MRFLTTTENANTPRDTLQSIDKAKNLDGKDKLESSKEVDVRERNAIADVNDNIGVDLGQCRKVSTDEGVHFREDRKVDDVALGKSDDEIHKKVDIDRDNSIDVCGDIDAYEAEDFGLDVGENVSDNINLSGDISSDNKSSDDRLASVIDVLAGVVDVSTITTSDELSGVDGAGENAGSSAEESDGGDDELGEEHGGKDCCRGWGS